MGSRKGLEMEGMLNEVGTEGTEPDRRAVNHEWYGSVRDAVAGCIGEDKRILLISYKASFRGTEKVGVVNLEAVGLCCRLDFTWRSKLPCLSVPESAVAMARAAELGMERVLEEMERWERDLERKDG